MVKRFLKIIAFCFAVMLIYGLSTVIGYINVDATPNLRQAAGSIEEGFFGRFFRGFKDDKVLPSGARVYAGGFPLGFSLKIDGLMVEDIGTVETAAGDIQAQTTLRKGDIIKSVNGVKISRAEDITGILQDTTTAPLSLQIMRNGTDSEAQIVPLMEDLSGRYRLGIWIKERISGIGTVSYVKGDLSFAALGHPIAFEGNIIPISGGEVYDCEILGIVKGKRGQPGEIKGVLKNSSIGKVYKNTPYGIYGVLNNLPNTDLYEVCPREQVTAGKAKIYTTIDGKADFYDIDIIRAMGQSKRSDKSLIIRVTDRRLLEKTNGIIQGMSGSPIFQDGKLVGSVTHVFVNDPTKGYGIYADWMFE